MTEKGLCLNVQGLSSVKVSRVALSAADRDRPPRTNRLLAALPSPVLDVLRPDLEPVPLPPGLVLVEVGQPIKHAYFPLRGVVSVLVPLKDHPAPEVATIGFEGMVGLPALLGDGTASIRALVQVEGEAVRIEAGALRRALDAEPVLRVLLLRYAMVLMNLLARNNACHRAHSIDERCARWLLTAHDQVHQDSFMLTQEFFALMLGVSRPTVSIAASELQRAGLISYVRGRITILNRPALEAASCDCYGAAREQVERALGAAA